MMERDVLAMVRVIAGELDNVDDKTVLAVIDYAKPFLSEKRFGPMYNNALAYYAAHLLTLRGITAAGGAMDASLVAGPVTSEKEGDLQRSYGEASNSKAAASVLSKTIYGRQFLDLASRCIVPVVTRRG